MVLLLGLILGAALVPIIPITGGFVEYSGSSLRQKLPNPMHPPIYQQGNSNYDSMHVFRQSPWHNAEHWPEGPLVIPVSSLKNFFGHRPTLPPTLETEPPYGDPFAPHNLKPFHQRYEPYAIQQAPAYVPSDPQVAPVFGLPDNQNHFMGPPHPISFGDWETAPNNGYAKQSVDFHPHIVKEKQAYAGMDLQQPPSIYQANQLKPNMVPTGLSMHGNLEYNIRQISATTTENPMTSTKSSKKRGQKIKHSTTSASNINKRKRKATTSTQNEKTTKATLLKKRTTQKAPATKNAPEGALRRRSSASTPNSIRKIWRSYMKKLALANDRKVVRTQ